MNIEHPAVLAVGRALSSDSETLSDDCLSIGDSGRLVRAAARAPHSRIAA